MSSAKKALAFLVSLNAALLLLAFLVKLPEGAEWIKGPLRHRFSVYSCENAPRVFFITTAFFIDAYLALLFFLHRSARLRGRLVSVAFMLIALVCSFAGTEYLLRGYMARWQAGTWYRPHPLLLWWNRPGVRDFRNYSDGSVKAINSQGFRYPKDIPLRKPGNEYRIFTLGNSSAFGVGVKDEETFTARLEKMLQERTGGRYVIRAVNAACPGHTTFQNLAELRTMIIPLQPDVVIIANNNDAAQEYVEEKARAYKNPVMRALNEFLYRSDYYLLFQRIAVDLRPSFRRAGKPATVPRVSLEDYRANIIGMAELAKAYGFRIIFVNMPVNYAALDRFPFLRRLFYRQEYQDALAGLCAERGEILVDIDKSWGKDKEQGLFETVTIDGIETAAHFHPSAEGHLKMAGEICDAIIRNKLISAEGYER